MLGFLVILYTQCLSFNKSIIFYFLQFLYVNQAFAPSPDQTVKNVFDCFGTDGKLILHYCKSQAWG